MFKTRRRALVIDQLSSGLITVVGLSVILAVAGMMLFLFISSWPLFSKETLVDSGELLSVPVKSEGRGSDLIFDDIAPIGFVLPNAEQGDCLILARSVSNLHKAGDKKKAQEKRSSFLKQFRLQKNPSAASDATLPALILSPAGTESQTSPVKLECSSQGENRLLIRDGNSLRSGRLELVRTFMTGSDLQMLTEETRSLLLQEKWAVQGEELFVKAAEQSPTARVNLQFETDWSVESFFSATQPVQLSDLAFIRKPGKPDGLLLSSIASPDGAKKDSHTLLTLTQNEVTGESTATLTQLPAERFGIPLQGSLHSRPVWIDGRYLVFASGPNDFRVVDSENVAQQSAVLRTPAELGTLRATSAVYGGGAIFAEFESAGVVKCASLDAGRASRLGFASTDQSAQMPVLWSDSCAPSVRIISHPHQRAVYRWLESADGNSDASLEVRELTTGRIAATKSVSAGAHRTAVIDAKGYTLGVRQSGSENLKLIRFNAPHLEISLKSLFSKIHYESYEAPSYSWQSTSGTDEFQAKFSLIPLIWGTIKATLYSLLFAVPLAIFAAVYSSEILDRQTRNVVKPTLEMMASVPSVVLGFLAAIVVAPWIENHILSVLLIGVSMPFMLYMGGVIMQVPSARYLTSRGLYASRRLLVWVIVGFAGLIWALSRIGLWIEQTAFGGDLKAFLSGGPGTEGVLWGLLLLPLVFISLWSLPVQRARNFFRVSVFLLGPIISLWIGSLLADHTPLRGDVLGQYAQRNTLVIAIAMGFAIIPIIYSLAEDALTSVPNSLRAGSLACGASVWQTTARVVLPTAASGLFSAVMVGLGRGIGETMIAVMATGNTAVMTLNPFDGLRSMAANIAVELPEAAQGSTHYRILFLSALVLFAFTFTLNSFAEFLRARYRARNKAL